MSDIASGKTPTVASTIRQFVHKHPDYKNDSVINQEIASDLLKLYTHSMDKNETFFDSFKGCKGCS